MNIIDFVINVAIVMTMPAVIIFFFIGLTVIFSFVYKHSKNMKFRRYFCESCGEMVTKHTVRRPKTVGVCSTCGQLPGDGGIYRETIGRP